MIKSFKIRIYPTKEQEKLLWKHIGACRYIWNYMLALQEQRYKAGEKHLSDFDMINRLKPLKNDGEHEWLYDISATSLQIICRDLGKAYTSFFKKQHKHPKFKSKKKAKPNFPVNEMRFYFTESYVQIQKIGKVKYKTDFDVPLGREVKFSNVRISYIQNKWILSFGLECENQVVELNDFNVGIDLGIKELAVVAYDDSFKFFHNINKSRKINDLKRRLRHEQRSVNRKYEQNKRGNCYIKTNNIMKKEEEIRRLHRKISNIRDNYIHQITRQIVNLKSKRIVMEDLNVSGMMKNKHLSRAIAEQEFYKFKQYIQYKCEWAGIEFVQVDRFYPSSKMCSVCGCTKHDLKLNDRVYKCDECGHEIDRDLNAAINLMNYVI